MKEGISAKLAEIANDAVAEVVFFSAEPSNIPISREPRSAVHSAHGELVMCRPVCADADDVLVLVRRLVANKQYNWNISHLNYQPGRFGADRPTQRVDARPTRIQNGPNETDAKKAQRTVCRKACELHLL